MSLLRDHAYVTRRLLRMIKEPTLVSKEYHLTHFLIRQHVHLSLHHILPARLSPIRACWSHCHCRQSRAKGGTLYPYSMDTSSLLTPVNVPTDRHRPPRNRCELRRPRPGHLGACARRHRRDSWHGRGRVHGYFRSRVLQWPVP
jgi:hypothetical protein